MSGQKFLHNPLEAARVVQKDMVVGVRNLSQFEGRTLCLGLSDELRRDARTAAALDDECRDGNLPAVWDPIEAIALRIDIAVELVRPGAIGELSATTFGEMANDLRGGGRPVRTKPVVGEKLLMGGVSAPWAVPDIA